MHEDVIRGIMEIIVYAEEMSSLVAFYHDRLGLPVRYPAGLTDYGDQMWVELDAGNCVLALHGGGQRRLGADAPKIVFRVDDMTRLARCWLGAASTWAKCARQRPASRSATALIRKGTAFRWSLQTTATKCRER